MDIPMPMPEIKQETSTVPSPALSNASIPTPNSTAGDTVSPVVPSPATSVSTPPLTAASPSTTTTTTSARGAGTPQGATTPGSTSGSQTNGQGDSPLTFQLRATKVALTNIVRAILALIHDPNRSATAAAQGGSQVFAAKEKGTTFRDFGRCLERFDEVCDELFRILSAAQQELDQAVAIEQAQRGRKLMSPAPGAALGPGDNAADIVAGVQEQLEAVAKMREGFLSFAETLAPLVSEHGVVVERVTA